MADRLERDVHNVERGAEALLREHPDALVCGIASDGQIVPVPQSVGLWGQGAIEGRAVTDVVIAEDCMTAVEAWRRVQQEGTAQAKVRLLSKPTHWVTLHLLDLRANHGVFLCILLPGEEAPAPEPDGQLFEAAPAPPLFCTLTEDEAGIVLDIDEAFTQMLGYGAEDVIGKPILDQVHPDDVALTVERWIAMLATHRDQRFRARRRHKNGHFVWLDITLRNHLNHPDRNHVLLELVDVSAEMAAAEALQEKCEVLRGVLEDTPDGLLQVDNERQVVYHNARLRELLQRDVSPRSATPVTPDGDTGQDREPSAPSLREMLDSVSDEGVEALLAELDCALAKGVDRDLEVDVARRMGGWRRVLVKIRVLRSAGGEVNGAVIRLADSAESARARRVLDSRHRLDSLTGCQHRAAIFATLQRELDRSASTRTGVVYIELHDLVAINDTLGRTAGDELLRLVAERLRGASRDNAEIGRLGGDEFLVVLPELPSQEVAMGVARRIEASLRLNADLSCGSAALRASVGVACAGARSIRAERLVKRAKAASRSSKAQRALDRVSPSPARNGRSRARAAWSAWRVRSDEPRADAMSPSGAHGRPALSTEEAERRLAQHTRKHDAVAYLGQVGLREHEQDALFDQVAATVARTLDVELCAVLRLRESEHALDIVSSVGYSHGPTVLPAGASSQSGYALSKRAPVVVQDLRAESRFDPRLLLEQGMLSGMTVVIEGRDRPFGVICAHSSRCREFGQDDVNFLVAIANVVSAAVERERKEDSAKHAALHDPLTGLPNRTLALDRIDRALARRRRDGIDVAVLLLGIDRFKLINDSLGHEAGDEVLLALAARLDEALRRGDTIARLGGDEFLVVSEQPAGPRSVVELAERLGEAVSRPLSLESGEHHLSASIGVALASQGGDTAASLLRDADAAMNRAKDGGRGRYELFDETVRAQVVSRLRTETELRHALEREQLEVHYQPILDAVSGQPVAAEALVRWRHPRHGLVPPLEFIPIAEETGLIRALGLYVLERASAQGAAWQRRYGTPLRIYVNVSGAQLADVGFPAQAVEIARRSGLVPETLGLEVTESVLIADAKSSLDVLTELAAHGLPLVLDDFGIGYSSLSYLRRFPLSAVKVDRSFIDGLGSSQQDAAIMRAIVEMCSALGLSVVAEGVETQAQLRQLRELGCDHVQGFLFCRPMPVEEASEFLDGRFEPEALDRAA
jgi:diguanylate cyclase (GGDEF)-like protein/PAS domain S-box-containing protein